MQRLTAPCPLVRAPRERFQLGRLPIGLLVVGSLFHGYRRPTCHDDSDGTTCVNLDLASLSKRRTPALSLSLWLWLSLRRGEAADARVIALSRRCRPPASVPCTRHYDGAVNADRTTGRPFPPWIGGAFQWRCGLCR